MRYDNWKLMAPLDCKIYGKCDFCKDMIFEGEDIIDSSQGTIHKDCLLPLAYKEFNCRTREAREEDT